MCVVAKTNGVVTGGLYVLFVAGTACGKKILRTDAMLASDALCWVSRLRHVGVECQLIGATGYSKKRYPLAVGWRDNLAAVSQQALEFAAQVLEPCIH